MKYLFISLVALLVTGISACHKKTNLQPICGTYTGHLESTTLTFLNTNDTNYNCTITILDCNNGNSFCIASGGIPVVTMPQTNPQFDYDTTDKYNYLDSVSHLAITYLPAKDSIYIYSTYYPSAAIMNAKTFSGKKI